ncbi:MAG: tetratricopeptide repeat protein [Thermoanaerobaculia bacterium]
MVRRVAIILLTVLALGPVQPVGAAEDNPIGPLLEGMGTHHHPITTEDSMVQRYFDQGLVLAYGFNHAEAARSFREAIRRDPDCASCYWGLSYVLGPNINSMMNAEDLPEAWKALQKAVALVDSASEQEQAYIRALETRYTKDLPEDRSHLDVAYADAMREVARRYPKDTDAGTLFAEALMDTTPWDYWRENGKPKPETVEILETLTAVIDRDPNHPGANHLYIHIVEAQQPEMAVAAADRLGGLVPGAGHLVHMPSHIYIRMGRYHDASVANQKAIAADDDYVTACRKQGLYPVMYMPHNHHFLWAAASIEGRSELAISAAREIARNQDLDVARQPGLTSLQHYWITPVYALTRFGKWEAILEEPAPPDDMIYPLGVWHYARGIALTRLGRLDQAKTELARLTEIGADPELELVTVWDLNTTDNLIAIAREVLSGEIAAAEGDYETALRHLEAGVELEDALVYDEPPTWHAPVRLNLGAVLLAAGRPAEAEKIYREDLETFPDNGWALLGLEQSLEAQGKTDEATAVAGQFKKAWQHADIELASSRL